MDEQYIYLIVVIEALAVLGLVAAHLTRDTRMSFLVGFNTLLPVTVIICAFGDGPLWRQLMIVGFVGLYVVRMNWVLIAWYGNTAASKLKDEMPAPVFGEEGAET